MTSFAKDMKSKSTSNLKRPKVEKEKYKTTWDGDNEPTLCSIAHLKRYSLFLTTCDFVMSFVVLIIICSDIDWDEFMKTMVKIFFIFYKN